MSAEFNTSIKQPTASNSSRRATYSSQFREIFNTAKERYTTILDAKGQSRNGLMAFGEISKMDKVPHKVLNAPYRAFDAAPEFAEPLQSLCQTLAEDSLRTISDEIAKSAVDKTELLQYFKQQIRKNIRRSYAHLRSKYNIFEAFDSPEYARKLTIKDAQHMIKRIHEDPKIGIKAFTKRIRDVESIGLTDKELEDVSEFLEKIENSPPMSESNLSKELHKFPHIDQAAISALSEEYGRMVLQWDTRFIRETNVLGDTEKSYQLSDREIAKRWGEGLDNVLKSIFLQIEPFINELKYEYGIVEKIKGEVVHYSLPISNELRNKSPFELFRYMETATSPQESSLAQSMLMLIMQYLLVDNHPHYKNAHLVNLQFDAICHYDTESYSTFYRDKESQLWVLHPELQSKTAINEEEIELSIATRGSDLHDNVGNEDSNLEDGSMMSAINSIIGNNGPREEIDVFWRYWLSPEKRRQGYGMIPDGHGGERPLRFHLVGRAIKGIDAILSKFHNRRDDFGGIDDIVRARMVLDVTRDALDSSGAVQQQVELLARDTAENVLHLANFIPNTSADKLTPNSYTIISNFTPRNEGGTEKRKKSNDSSSRLWQDMKICGRTQDGTTIEVQLLPQDVYCLDIDANSPVSHTWYEIDRLIDFILSLLPAIYFKREHNLLNTIRMQRKAHKEEMTKQWEQKRRQLMASMGGEQLRLTLS